MKSTVLLLLLLKAIAFEQAASVDLYESKKQYVYDFKATSATGVGDETVQLSGFSLQGKVTLQRADEIMQLHMTELKYGNFNKEVDNILDEVDLEYNRLSEESQENIVNLLENPFYVEYQQGVFKAIYFTPNEDIAKHNNKKALASLFQFNLQQDGETFPEGYVTQEDSWDGVCDTTYIIQDNEEILTVTKLRNYEKCSVQPQLFHSSVRGGDSPTKEQYAPIIKDYSEVQYKLKKSDDQYFIQSIYSTSGFSVTPFTSSGQTIFTLVNQSLTLAEVVDDPPEFALPSEAEKQENLYHEFNRDKIPYNTKDVDTAHYYDRVFKTNRDDRMDQAESLYSQLEEALTSKTKTHQFIPQFVKVFQKFDFQDFVTFFSKLFDNAERKDSSTTRFVIKILPYIGTNPAIKYMLDVIGSGIFYPFSAGRTLIERFPFHVKEPSERVVDIIKDFYIKLTTEENPIKITQLLLHSTLLAYGTVLYKGCNEDDFNPRPVDAKHYIPRDVCSKYVQELIEKFQSAKNLNEKIIYAQTLKNVDTEDSSDFLSSIVQSNEHIFLKLKAMWAAGGNETSMLSILMDPEEDHVTRIYALDVLLHSDVSPAVYGKIVSLLNSDQSQKFKSHVYETLKTYSKPSRRTQEYHDQMKHLFKFAESVDPDLPIQTFLNLDSYFNAEYNYGRTDELWLIPDAKSALPRDILVSNQINVFGNTFYITELFFSSTGAPIHEELLAAFTNQLGLLPYNAPVNDDLVLETIKKFNFTSGFQREGPIQFYNRILSKEVFAGDDLLAFVQSLFPLLADIEIRNSSFEGDVTDVEYVNVELVRPNALGMPVYLTVDIPATHHVRGHVIGSENGDVYNADVDVNLGCDVTIHSKVFVQSLLFGNLGFELQTDMGLQLPVKGSGAYDMKQDKLTINYITSNEPYDLFYYETTSKTFDDDDQVPVHFSPNTVQDQYDLGHSYFGVGLTINVSHDDPFPGGYWKLLKSFYKDFEEQPHINSFVMATKHLMHYAIMNPTGKPFALNVVASHCNTNPTTEFLLETKIKLHDKDFGNFKTAAVLGHQLSATVTAKGPVERKWELHLNVSCRWPQMDNAKLIAQFKRTPIPVYDTKPLEVCFNSKSQITDDYWKIFNQDPVDIKEESKSELKWGETCDTDVSTADINMILEKSEEQKTIDTSNLDIYKKCKESVAKGYVVNMECWKVILDLGRLDKVTYNIDYDIKSESALFKRFSHWFRHKYYDNLYIDYSTGSEKPNHLEIVGNISYYHPDTLDFKVVQTDETAYYKNLYNPNIQPYTVAETCADRLTRNLFNYGQPICFISGNFVRTFDGLTYEAPLKDCHYLAFSEHYWNKTFIYYKGVKTEQYTLAVKIYLQQHVIEFVPNDETIAVSVDGQNILEEDTESYYLPTASDRTESNFLQIFKTEIGYILLSEPYGLRFYYTGRDSYIKASHFYRGKQQGLCGNFDGESYNDLQGPDGTDYQDATSFAENYAIEDNCK